MANKQMSAAAAEAQIKDGMTVVVPLAAPIGALDGVSELLYGS